MLVGWNIFWVESSGYYQSSLHLFSVYMFGRSIHQVQQEIYIYISVSVGIGFEIFSEIDFVVLNQLKSIKILFSS